MKIHKEELQRYIKENYHKIHRETELSSVYFMITYKDGSKEPLYFYSHNGYYFDAPCVLVNIGNSLVSKKLFDFVKEQYTGDLIEAYNYEKTMMLNGKHYDIDCPQCNRTEFPEEFDIEPLTERECLEWLVHSKEMKNNGIA